MNTQTKPCSVCGGAIRTTASFCSHCGARQAQYQPYPTTPVSPAYGHEVTIFERKGERPGIRFGAFFTDMFIVGLISSLLIGLLALTLVEVGSSSNIESAAALLIYILIPVVMTVYFVFFEGILGTTPGKMIGTTPWQLAVVKKAGGRCGLGRAILRFLLLPFEANLIGAIVIWATEENQRIGDLLAGTLVVDRRKPHRVTFLDGGAVFDLLDGRRFAFAYVESAKIIYWLQFRRVKIKGTAPDGRPLRLTMNFSREKYRMDRLRDEMERALPIQFSETIEWWRVVILVIGLFVLLSMTALVIALMFVPPINWY